MIIRATTIKQYLILIAAFITLSSSACKFNSNPIQQNTQRCGNGIKEAAEECDDGNRNNGDGCSQACKLDDGYVCEGTHCHAAKCGDGIRAGAESCDDGNNEDRDGCNRRCEVEAGYSCSGQKSVCRIAGCGDGIKVPSEACDDGNSEASDGCSQTCDIEPGYVCSGANGAKSVCQAARCGDGIVAGSEKCDDGNSKNGDGCSSACVPEVGYTCSNTPTGSSCKTTCGDGIVAGTEQCDDGNKDDSDGCSNDCTILDHWECEIIASRDNAAGGRSLCTRPCGNLFLTAANGEECDDGNIENGDGCSDSCHIEEGYDCQPPFTDSPLFSYPQTIYLPITYRSFNKELLDSSECVASSHDNNNHESSSNVLSSSLSSIYAVPRGKSGACQDQDNGGVYTSTPNPYQFIFTDHSKERAIPANSWISHSFVKADLNENGTAYYFLQTIDSTDYASPSTIDTSSGEARLFTAKEYISAVLTVDIRFEASMRDVSYEFTSNDDVMIYLDGHLVYADPGDHHRHTFSVTLFPSHQAFQVGSIHTLSVFYMNRSGTGRIAMSIPKTIVHLPSICSKCGNGKVEKGEECDGKLLQWTTPNEHSCSADCKVYNPLKLRP